MKESPLTLELLTNRFFTESAEFLDNKPRTQLDAKARARYVIAYFGAEFIAANLTRDDQRRYEVNRRAGSIVLRDGTSTPPTRARSAEADVVLLHQMLWWATTVRLPSGTFLLERNPLHGVRREREKNKRQPVATFERYTATIEAMRSLSERATTDEQRALWKRMEFALFLAEATGRRLGSIRALRWEDFSTESQTVHWRAEADKKGIAWNVPMPAEFFEQMRKFQRALRVVAGAVFAAPRSRDGMMDRHLFDKWLVVAEREAQQVKLRGGLWHPYRRKWATERKHLPPRDVAAAGGWKDVTTLLEVYQQADEASVLAVMCEPRKLGERGLTRIAENGNGNKTANG